MKKSLEYLMWAAIVAPLIYLAVVWNQLPDIVPTHFGVSGKPNGFGPKWTLAILSVVSVGLYFLMRYVPHLDPRLNQASLSEHYPKLILVVLTFFGAIQMLIIRSAIEQKISGIFMNVVFVGVFLLLAGIGNYLNTIKSNYFVGIRTPWTLESETVWRKTHQLGSKLFFAMGIIGALVVVWLPDLWKTIWTLSLILTTTLWIVVYSYRVYRQEQKA
ncbi:SdpI family protein [Runella sp.]|uniref:SdpI family protein n=1 Tax=Runella sp. TaxID=1960881 RepID=UPI003D150587